MDFGDTFCKGINAIYAEQRATMIINSDITEEYPINKGTRQGCPLSPLIFILILEVLNKLIQEDSKIKELTLGERVYKAKAFTDDLLIITHNPKESLHRSIEILS